MSAENEAAEAEPPSLTAGFFILLIVIVGIVSWIFLGSAVKVTSFYASFLFLWYWAVVDKLDFKKFIPSMVGALLGIAFAWGPHMLPHYLGVTNGIILGIALIALAVYLVIVERLPFAFNPALTLYLTVMAAPVILETSDFRELALATLLGGGFFGLFVFAVMFIVSKIQGGAQTS